VVRVSWSGHLGLKKKKIEYLIFYVKEIKNKKMAQLMGRAKFT
jgi:hypothetical protein